MHNLITEIQISCREIPPGFKTSMDSEVMRITFHALLPVQCWGIQEPKIYLRFGNDALGQWKYDHGPGSIERYYSVCMTISLWSQLIGDDKLIISSLIL